MTSWATDGDIRADLAAFDAMIHQPTSPNEIIATPIRPENYAALARGRLLLFIPKDGAVEMGYLLYAKAREVTVTDARGWSPTHGPRVIKRFWHPLRCGFEPAVLRHTLDGRRVFSVHLEAGRFSIARMVP